MLKKNIIYLVLINYGRNFRLSYHDGIKVVECFAYIQVGKKSSTSSQQPELSNGRSSFRPSPNLTFPQAETPSESSGCCTRFYDNSNLKFTIFEK